MASPAPGQDGSQRRLRLGRYDLIAQLGSGGMADVYLAVVRGPAGFNKLVVLKVLRAQFVHDGEFLKMFLDEARLSARFNHPNVVQTFEVEEDQGRYFLVMEYLEGHPLANLEANHADMPLPVSVRVLVDVLSGLHYAHELTDSHGQPLGIVHRDVSPQNVFVTYDGPAKLLDFGVAKAKNAIAQTQDGAIKGKVRYMAPEQVTGEALDRRADVFAAGILLWRAATGKKLWDGFDQLGIMHRLVAGDPVPPPRSVRPEVPRLVDAICAKALSLKPQDRFQTAAEFGAALDEFLHGCGAQGGHRAVARYLEERYAAARSKFQGFVDERLRALEALPVERVLGLGTQESRRWHVPYFGDDEASVSGGGSTARGVVAASRVSSSHPPSFGALSDFPAPISTGRPGPGPQHSPSFSAVTPAKPPPRRQWPVVFGAAGLAVGVAALLTPLAARYFFDGDATAGGSAAASVGVVPAMSAPPAHAGAEPADASASASAVGVESLPPARDHAAPHPGDGARGAGAAGGGARPGAVVRGGGDGARGAPPRPAPPPRRGGAAEAVEPKEAPVKGGETHANEACASPYFIDERGVKKIKPECL